jgi:hypothetical protein
MAEAALQDSKGHFVKGHQFIGNRNGVPNGAKKSLKTEVKNALQIAEDAMPAIFLDMIHDAQSPDTPPAIRQACREYLADRIYGKPNQPLSNAGNMPLIAFIIGMGYTSGGDIVEVNGGTKTD